MADYQHQAAKLNAVIDLVFDAVDKDNSGSVEEKELRVFLRQQVSFTEDECKCVFHAFDANKDGKMDKEEFRKLFLKKQQAQEESSLVMAEKAVENPGCISCLTMFAYCCCVCTAGLSCCPLYCYLYCMGRGLLHTAKDKLLTYARAQENQI
eukprot:jgi/Bigna1/90311/estExt_fgenesh1_pg.C_670039